MFQGNSRFTMNWVRNYTYKVISSKFNTKNTDKNVMPESYSGSRLPTKKKC